MTLGVSSCRGMDAFVRFPESREMSAAARVIKVLSSVNLNDDVGGAERRHFGFRSAH